MDNEHFYLMGTGSRSMLTSPHAKEIYQFLRDWILEFRLQHPNLVLISGMAEGWDEAVAKVGMREGIPYICALPNPTYGSYYWGRKSLLGENRMSVFNSLLSHAQDVIYVCDEIYVNNTHSNFIRNSWMVNHANAAVVYMAHSSGTRDAVAKLHARQIPMTHFDKNGVHQPELPL